MLISNLKITGYRSLASIDINLHELLILVGRNNAGKSNILSAINLLLEGTKSDLSKEDFHKVGSDYTDQLSIEAQFTGVTAYLPLCSEVHRPKIEACVVNDAIRIRRTARHDPIDLSKIEIWQPAKGEFGIPTGLDAAFKQFLPEVIFIEAFKDPNTEASSNKSTTILAKLLKQIITQMNEKIGEDVSNALVAAQRKFNVIEEDGKTIDERPDDLKRIQNRINDHVREIFSESQARLVFKFPDLDALMTSASVELRDHQSGPWTSPALKGQGFQRSLYVALLEALADEIRQRPEGDPTPRRPFILLFEEPEIFLHPALQREIGDILEAISTSNQVALVTHSPMLVTPFRIDSVLIVRQSMGEANVVQSECICPNADALPNPEDKHLTALLKYTNSAEFLFSDFVIVVEGPSDRELLNAVWKKVKKQLLPASNLALAVIDAGSKAVVPTWVRHLKAIGLDAAGMVDLDFLWDGAGKCLKGHKGLSQLAAEFWKLCDERNLSEVKDGNHNINSSMKTAAYSILNTELRPQTTAIIEALRCHRIWTLQNGEIECYFGLSQSSKGQYSIVSQKIARGEVDIAQEIIDFLEWGIKDAKII